MNGLNQVAGVRCTHTPMYALNDVDRCASRFRLLRKPWLLLAALLVGSSAMAASIEVPNGDFSDPANNGSIGGLLGPNLNNQPIGTGPWLGTSLGVLGILARPVLTVDSGSQTATISGLLGINLGGLLNNGGWFSQELVENYETGRFYILSADISAGEVLDLGLLTDTNVGIGLTSGGAEVATSTTVDPSLLSLGLLGGDQYRLRFGWFADASASGPIGIRLFNRPVGLVQASLLGSTVFENVALEGRDIGPATQVVIVPDDDGGGNETGVGQPFPGAFIAIVQDEDGDGVPGFAVSIAAPLDGASADLTSPSSNDPPGRVITAVTDLDGVVSFDATANEIAGCYRVLITAADPELTVESGVFHFRNVSDDPAQDSIYCNGFQ